MDSPRSGQGAGQNESRSVEKVSTLDEHGDAKGAKGRFGMNAHTDEEPYLGPPVDDSVEDITTGQKMLSAVSGSLFTSLIGSLSPSPPMMLLKFI